MKAMCGACWIESSRDLTTGQTERRQRYACNSGGGGWEALPMSCNKIGGRPAKKEAKLWKRSHDVDKTSTSLTMTMSSTTRQYSTSSFHLLVLYNKCCNHTFGCGKCYCRFLHLFVRSFLFFFCWMCNIQQSYFCVLLVVHDRDCRRPATLQR